MLRPVIALILAATLPSIPPLPADGYPSTSKAEPFARELVAKVPPAQLEAMLIEDPQKIPGVLRNLGSALMTSDPALRRSLEQYLPQVTLAHAKRLSPIFSPDNHLRLLTAIQVIDPVRYREDAKFRARVNALLPRTLDASISSAIREASLRELNAALEADFETAEKVALAWGYIPRKSSENKLAWDVKQLRMPDDLSGPIETSFFSINSTFFTQADARAFLKAVREASPKRRIVVLGDPPIKPALDGLNVDFVDTFGRAYTPWPRDPFSVARDKNGVVFVNRPNLQPDREDDANMVRALIQGVPGARWTVAPMPFHNGHVLLTPDAAWISEHTVEIRALQILGLKRVPVDTFNTKAGIEKYLNAVKRAGKELETLYRRPVRFVHPLDSSRAGQRKLAGGGGYDLDSLVTILPGNAIVGDITLGAKLARDADWTTAYKAYRFNSDEKTLGTRVADAQNAKHNQGLDGFLDTVAASLAKDGMTVHRVPLINVPAALVSDAPKDFLLTWNNVVLEDKRAEGFASLLPEGDALAREVFAEAGFELDLYPPLIRSVVLSGGYRCASNHLRPITAP